MPVITAFGTLIATLIGVWTAFSLDRISEARAEKREALHRVRAIIRELEGNNQLLNEHRAVIKHFQRGRQQHDPDHYTVKKLSSQSLGGVSEHNLVEHLPEGVYGDLQEVFLEVTNLNELVSRLRFEMLHPELGQMEMNGGYKHEIWTVNIGHFDSNQEEVRTLGLGPLILREGGEVQGKIADVMESLANESERLSEELDRSWKDEISVRLNELR